MTTTQIGYYKWLGLSSEICSKNPSQDPSPFHLFPFSLSPGEREEGKGSGGYSHVF